MLASEIPVVFPTPCESNPGPYYVSTGSDSESGTAFGRIVARNNREFYVLTPRGLRYYNLPDNAVIIDRSHWNFAHIHAAWTTALSVLKVALR